MGGKEGETLLPVEKWQFPDTCEMQSNNDKHYTANLAQLELVITEKAPRCASRRAKRNECKGKAKDKHHGVEKGCQTGQMTLLFLDRL